MKMNNSRGSDSVFAEDHEEAMQKANIVRQNGMVDQLIGQMENGVGPSFEDMILNIKQENARRIARVVGVDEEGETLYPTIIEELRELAGKAMTEPKCRQVIDIIKKEKWSK